MNVRTTLIVSVFMIAGFALNVSGEQPNAVPAHPAWENSLKPSGTPGPEITLAENGQALYRIVLPGEPTSQEQKSAADLKLWLDTMSGASFEIVAEGDDVEVNGREISVGRTRLLTENKPAGHDADLGDEGYAIASEDDRVYLFGGSRRGPIYAVYAFLEEDLGCRWYAGDSATIPHRPTLSVAPVRRTFTPALERRDPFYSDARHSAWSLRNKTASHAVYIPAAWGGYPKFPGHFVHTYNLLMPPEEFFDDHPEYFSLFQGERTDLQLCPTHSEVQRIMVERVLGQLERCPDCRYVDVSPNDWRYYCECPRCHALDEAEGTQAASLLMLVNHVAEKVAKVRPEVTITTLAYLGTYQAPKTMRPRDNVQIVLCTDSHAWDYALLPVEETTDFTQALEAWEATGANVKIWDYVVDFPRHMRPLPNFEVVQENIRLFVKHEVRGVFAQGSHSSNFGIDRARARSWVLAKQLWDPSLDHGPLLRDFFYGYYGKAAEPLYMYNRMLHERWVKAYEQWKGEHPEPAMHDVEEYRRIFHPIAVDFDDAFIDRAKALSDEAMALAEGNAELVRRVEYFSLPILYLLAERGPGEDREAYLVMLNRFERLARREKAVFTRDAYGGPDLDRRLHLWRSVAMIDPEAVHAMPLDNTWWFKPDPGNVGVTREWFDPKLDDSEWGTVRSDLGHRGWESQGYAEYEVGYGWYRQTFTLPEPLDDMENLRLLVGAVDEQAEIWINGRKALSHTSETLKLSKDFLWNTPFHFDPKRYLIDGEPNQITIRVHNALHVGGIWKPVYLTWGQPVTDLHALMDLLRLRFAKRSAEEQQP